MIYSDSTIRELLRDGSIAIEGLRPEAIQPASVDLHLSDRPMRCWARSSMEINPWVDQSGDMLYVPQDDLGSTVLYPGEFVLASTDERVVISNKAAGRLEGKSSLARLGLTIHTTAGFFDPGFEGWPTLELVNNAPRPIRLRPGMPIAQMAFFPMCGTVEAPYGTKGKYQDQGRDPQPSRYHRNFTPQRSDTNGRLESSANGTKLMAVRTNGLAPEVW